MFSGFLADINDTIKIARVLYLMKQFPLKGTDYIEIYVFNALQAANFYRTIFGFDIIAYGGPETGLKDQISYLLLQGSIRLLISSGISRGSSILKHVINHDESVKDIAFTIHNVPKLYEAAKRAGAISVLEPTEIYDGKVRTIKATIAAFGNTVHSFIERENLILHEFPFYTPLNYLANKNPIGLEKLDHVAIAVETGSIEKWQKFYEDVLGFCVLYAEDVYTNDSGMKSVVVSDPTKTIKFVLVEGVSIKKKSQIENYISYHGCSGVQHLAFSTKDIIKAANLLQNQGIKFLEIPGTYYDNISPILKDMLKDKMQDIRYSNILVDLEQHGYLMQMFTRPLQNRPTSFIEIVQRENSTGFGSNNIKALFEAVAKDQQRAMINVL
jgi:4-hydroxyphenylpyruvate dioxygenase